MKKYLLPLLGVCLLLLVAGELIGRTYGLTSFPLFVADPDYEYISAPNQDVEIFGHHFLTNQYSQRSEQLLPGDTLVSLLVGDSVPNGVNDVDQDSLASSLIEKRRQQETGKRIRILNISAPSWGPDNVAAYLKKHGTFGAKKIVLVVSSHDAHDNMTFRPIVGQESHPSKNAPFAVIKIGQKVYERFSGRAVSVISNQKEFNPGFESLRLLTDSLRIPFAIYLHKTLLEIQAGQLEPGGKEIIAYARQHKIPLFLRDERPSMFVDYIHLNNSGHRFLSEQLYPIFSN